MIEKNTARVWKTPYSSGHSQWSHVLEHGKPGFCSARDRHYDIRPLIIRSLATIKATGEEGFPEIRHCYIVSVFLYNVR